MTPTPCKAHMTRHVARPVPNDPDWRAGTRRFVDGACVACTVLAEVMDPAKPTPPTNTGYGPGNGSKIEDILTT